MRHTVKIPKLDIYGAHFYFVAFGYRLPNGGFDMRYWEPMFLNDLEQAKRYASQYVNRADGAMWKVWEASHARYCPKGPADHSLTSDQSLKQSYYRIAVGDILSTDEKTYDSELEGVAGDAE